MQEAGDEEETVNFDPFVGQNLEGDEEQDTLDAGRIKRGRAPNVGPGPNEKGESKSPSPR